MSPPRRQPLCHQAGAAAGLASRLFRFVRARIARNHARHIARGWNGDRRRRQCRLAHAPHGAARGTPGPRAGGRTQPLGARAFAAQHRDQPARASRGGWLSTRRSAGHAEFCGARRRTSGIGHVVADDTAPLDAIHVAASTLDVIAAEQKLDRLDLVKIDAEGFEWPILQGAQTTIARFRPYIVFEFDQAYAARGRDSGRLFADFFQRHNYRLFAVGRNWAELIDNEKWPSNANIFASPMPADSAPAAQVNPAAPSA